MNAQKTQSVMMTFLYSLLLIGLVSTLIMYIRSGSTDSFLGLAGLLIGGIACGGNYLLLHLMVKWLSEGSIMLSIQTYLGRMLIYLGAAFLTTKLGMPAVLTFSASIIAISFSVFYVYGIKVINEVFDDKR